MSATVPGPAAELAGDGHGEGLDWGLIVSQFTGILRLELRRNLFSRRAFFLYFLAFAPVVLFLLWPLFPVWRHFEGPREAIGLVFTPVFCGVGGDLIPVGYLRVVIFLGTLITFMSLYRSEVLEKSLHYYYLTPVRRWVIVVGKYASALLSTCGVFAVATTALFVLTCIPWGLGETYRYIFQGPGLGVLLAYIGIAILACIGYGAVFLLLGLFFRNAIIPALFLWVWESSHFILPQLAQKISVIHYLRSIYPIPMPQHALTFVTSSTSPWISVPGLMIFTALVLTFAGWRARHMEISYGGE